MSPPVECVHKQFSKALSAVTLRRLRAPNSQPPCSSHHWNRSRLRLASGSSLLATAVHKLECLDENSDEQFFLCLSLCFCCLSLSSPSSLTCFTAFLCDFAAFFNIGHAPSTRCYSMHFVVHHCNTPPDTKRTARKLPARGPGRLSNLPTRVSTCVSSL